MHKQRQIVSHLRIARVFACVLAATLVAATSINQVKATSGDLDTSFGNGGVVTTRLSPTESEEAEAVAIQKDGRIVIGINHRFIGEAGDFILMRYNTNGTLDTTFGVGGVVQTNFLGFGGVVTSVKIDPKGRIVAAGVINTNSPNSYYAPYGDFAVARYTASGALDTSFGSQGIFTRDHCPYESIEEIAIQPDGKIVAAGWAILPNTGTDYDFVIFRLTTNGALDPTFAGGNIVFTDFAGSGDTAYTLALQADGRIVVGGNAKSSYSGYNSVLGLARYNANGTLDFTFGVHGKVTTSIAGNADEFVDYCYELLVRPVPLSLTGEEQIIAVGSRYSPSDYIGSINYSLGALLCYLPDGSLNPSFGAGGIVLTSFSSRDSVTCAVRQADGKIVIAGQSYEQAIGFQFALARYNSNGTLDTSFGQGGIVRTLIGSRSIVNDLAFTPQGGIVAAGRSYSPGIPIAIAKYLP
jgi:serralysin